MFYDSNYQNRFSFPPNNQFPQAIRYPRFNQKIRSKPILDLSKILDTTQRSINTINQIVPLYKQVTPIVKQVSNFTKTMNNFLFKRTSTSNTNQNYNKQSNTNINFDYRNSENNSDVYYEKRGC